MNDVKILVTCQPCQVCGKQAQLEVSAAGFRKWKSGTHIQHAFPELSADQREMMISGTHPKCWDELWKE